MLKGKRLQETSPRPDRLSVGDGNRPNPPDWEERGKHGCGIPRGSCAQVTRRHCTPTPGCCCQFSAVSRTWHGQRQGDKDILRQLERDQARFRACRPFSTLKSLPLVVWVAALHLGTVQHQTQGWANTGRSKADTTSSIAGLRVQGSQAAQSPAPLVPIRCLVLPEQSHNQHVHGPGTRAQAWEQRWCGRWHQPCPAPSAGWAPTQRPRLNTAWPGSKLNPPKRRSAVITGLQIPLCG